MINMEIDAVCQEFRYAISQLDISCLLIRKDVLRTFQEFSLI